MGMKDVVVDTSAWIERLEASEVAARFAEQWPAQAHCIVPTIMQLEFAKHLNRVASTELVDEILAYVQECITVPRDTPLAFLAVELHRQHRLAAADAIVYAMAKAHDATLLTCDAHFEGLPGVLYFSKKATV